MQANLHSPQEAAQWLREHAVSALRTDHRRVQAGEGYLAYAGHTVDARLFVDQALIAGAGACVIEARDSDHVSETTHRVARYENLKAHSGKIAAAFYGNPARQLQVLAVTGTNGKTSTAWWLAQALNSQGKTDQCALIGTLGIGIPERDTSNLDGLSGSGLTTPDGVLLQHSLRGFVDQGLQFCALEASSIGIEENRLDGTGIRLAIFTNFTQDHLDYHGTMQAYWAAKRRLFDWPGLRAAVVNIDDDHGALLAQDLGEQSPHIDLWTVSMLRSARLQACDITSSAHGLHFSVREGKQRCAVQTRIIGSYNVSNLLGVIGALRASGMDLVSAVQACSALTSVPGRLQCVGGIDTPLAVVDYAHTPDALQKTLEVLRPLAQARGGAIWCLFGCGGDRDSAKRPLMGAIAASLADQIVLTSDNPRNESPSTIISHILAGMGGRKEVQVQTDRAMAIAQTLAHAAPQDVVLIAGKGHESTQEIAGQKFVFSDLTHAEQALAAWQPKVYA